MNRGGFSPFGGVPMMPKSAPMQMNPLQLVSQIKANPMQFLQRAGLNVPQNLNDPNAIIQHLMNSGQVSQERYNQARQMAERFLK